MDRGRKRPESSDPLPADKRACSSSARPDADPEPAVVMDCDRDSASSSSGGRSDRSAGYGSCDSDSDYRDAARSGAASRSKFQQIIAGLGDEAAGGGGGGGGGSAVLAFLTELCEVLSFCMEDALSGFPMDTAVPLLVKLANYESNPNIMLLAVRALTYLCDLMPRSADALVRHGAVPVLCGKLLAIEYLDVAEQCLQAMEKISKKQPVPCLQAGAIMAVLTYIDFFSMSIQRVALSTVANMCEKLPLDCSSLVMESVPVLCNLLQSEDRKIVETIATCLIRITERFSSSTELLDELCSHGVINKLLHLVAVDGRSSLSQTTYVGLIGTLTRLVNKSLLAVRTLFELNISSILKSILMASDLSHVSLYSTIQDSQSKEVLEVLKLCNQLVPSTSRETDDTQLILAKEKILREEPKFLHQFSADILPSSIQLVNSGANLYVCCCCVTVINNIVYFSTPDMLLDLLRGANISSFLAGLLTRKNQHVLFPSLKMVENLMQKLPGVFLSSFVKEGVMHAIDGIRTLENGLKSSPHQSSGSENQVGRKDTSMCLCHAFYTSSPDTKTCLLGEGAVRNLANRIKAAYFGNESVNSEMGVTETLRKLKTFCTELYDNGNKYLVNDISDKEDYLSGVVGQVLQELKCGDSMSTFEFIESGIVKSLGHYLCNGRYLQGTLGSNSPSSHSLAVLTRFQTFAAICLSGSVLTWEDMLATSLLRKLQSALSSLDTFPVVLSHLSKPRNNLADIPRRHYTVNPCLKVCFVREEGEENICECNEVLTVELSTSLDVIEKYIWSKVCKNSQAGESTKDLKAFDDASGSKAADVIHPQPHFIVTELPPMPNLPQAIEIPERHTSLVDSGARMRELTTGYPKPSISGRGQFHEETSSSSSSEDELPKLVFSFQGKQLDRSLTLYQAILESQINLGPDMILGPKFWNDIYKMTYKRAEQNTSSCVTPATSEPLFWEKIGFSWHRLSFFSSLLLAKLPCELEKSNLSYDILFMMKVLEGINHNSFHLLSSDKSVAFAQGRIKDFDDLKVVLSTIPQTEFINSKLTDKLEQQMRDPLVSTTGNMPLWCSEIMAVCPFLFSFETRWKYFSLTAFESYKTQQQRLLRSDYYGAAGFENERRPQAGLSHRKKFKVDRSSILESAAKLLESFARSKAVIEVEYNEEVGTGLGPTMEFFTLVSHEFQKVGLGMWREDNSSFRTSDMSFVAAPLGLFPRPWSEQASVVNDIQFSDVIKKFFLLGQFVAKAIRDRRILDLPLSRAFYKVILDQELGIYDIQSFDPELGSTVLEFQALVSRKRFLESITDGNQRGTFDLLFRNSKVEDLCLDFTLPGYSDYVLTGGSAPEMVNINNLEEYVRLVVNATIKDGICRQVEAFKSGFNEVFPLKSLQIFTGDELERLLCGERDTWDFSQLLDHMKFDHGYTASSTAITNLLEIIQEFGCDERRAFLQFVTGAPRLPPGGLAALNPKMTVVRKHCSNNPDMDLPSVMTCANYLKLPAYSSKERMKERLLYAITEGQGSFHLS